jgi:hypothetical protein
MDFEELITSDLEISVRFVAAPSQFSLSNDPTTSVGTNIAITLNSDSYDFSSGVTDTAVIWELMNVTQGSEEAEFDTVSNEFAIVDALAAKTDVMVVATLARNVGGEYIPFDEGVVAQTEFDIITI